MDDSKMLDSISIYTTDNVFIRKFVFDYSYYLSPLFMSQNKYFNNYGNNLKRLRLDRLTEYYDQNNKKPPYQFIYDQNILPPRGSFAQDYWGYFNGKISNKTPVPTFSFLDIKYDGANRETDTGMCKAGMLKSIINPMGGSTIFAFESNDFGHIPQGYINEQETVPEIQRLSLNFKNGTSNTLIKTFEIEFDQKTNIIIELSNTILNEGDGECSILDQNGVVVKQLRGSIKKVSFSKLYFLKKGIYSIKMIAHDNGDRVYCEIQYEKYTGKLIKTKYGGGIRIQSIQYNDDNQPNNIMIKKYIYRRFSETDRSSGCLVSDIPKYNYSYSEPIVTETPGFGMSLPSGLLYCNYEKFTSYPLSQMSTTNGSFIGYSEVTEIIGEKGENGRIQYKFTSPIEYKSYGDRGFPFTPTTNYDFARGLLLSASTYNNLGVLRSKVTNNYFFEKKYNYNEIIGTRIGITKSTTYLDPLYWSFLIEQYKVISQWKYLSSTINEEFDNNGQNPISSSIEFTYFNPYHAQLSEKKEINSDLSIITNQYLYPNDYPSVTSDEFSNAINLLQQKHVINLVIESITRIQNLNEKEKVISGTFVKYKEFNKGQVLPYQNYSLDLISPVYDFIPAVVQNNIKLKIDPRFRLVESFLLYDKFDNLLLYQKNKDIPISILWSYNFSLPVAKVLNAYTNQTAYNGFESNDKCGWEFNMINIASSTEAVAGQKILNLTTQLKKNDIPTGKYTLSFWMKGNITPNIWGRNLIIIKSSYSTFNSEQWKLCTYQINYTSVGDLIIDPGISIDEIRLCPEDAQMITYTYIPSFGINSVTNENNITNYFEYDKIGRLILKKDFDKNLLQFYQYHYKP